jgi:hypothetical protein
MTTIIHPGRGHGVKRTLEEAAALARQWQSSGQSKQAWCAERGILLSTLSSCLRRIRQREEKAPSTRPHTFIELQHVPSTAAVRPIRLTLAGGSAIAEVTVEELSALIERLAERQS